MSNVSIEDLALAADWLGTYEEATDDDAPVQAAMFRVRDWLLAEVAKREEESAVRNIVKQTGVSPARARAAFREVLARGQS